MTYRGHAGAVSNDLPLPPLEGSFEMTPELSTEEREALSRIGEAYARSTRASGPAKARATLKRLLAPVDFALDWVGTPIATRYATRHVLIVEMCRLGRSYWAWTPDDCLDVACSSFASFRIRHGNFANCRQQILALMCQFCAFDRVTEIGRFHRYHLAIKVFGRSAVDDATNAVYADMAHVGYTSHAQYGLAEAVHTAFLLQRESRLESITAETLKRIADAGPASLRRAAASLSRSLVRMGVLAQALDNYAEARRLRRAAPGEHSATDGIAPEWAAWCKRWRTAATGSDSALEKIYFSVLKFVRWLNATHPAVAGPADVTRAVAIDYVAAVDRMTVGEWSKPFGNAARTLGKPLKASSKAAQLKTLRRFLGDLQDWEWIPKRFEPARVLAVPRQTQALIGPAPRVVAEDIWAKLVWAGLNLAEADLKLRPAGRRREQTSAYYPIELVRAITHLWLFAGLRSDEISRLPVGCIRRQRDGADGAQAICLLDVPVNKTSTAYTKPVDAIVGDAVDAWERARCPHPRMLDRKTGSMTDFLFVHRGRRVAREYINTTLIPVLCAKAGVPREDARGPITSHRARATIATQLYNAKEPLTLFELKDWLGHSDVRATQHYAALSPTKLVAAFRRAGYFERNLRTISVLVDGDAVRSGAAVRGEPWRYYDLGHGLCTYDFFDQCPHRMACAKCTFYVPKASAKAQALEACTNLTSMLQEIPLLEEERAAIEDGLDAMSMLADGLRDTAAPDGRTPGEIAASRERGEERQP